MERPYLTHARTATAKPGWKLLMLIAGVLLGLGVLWIICKWHFIAPHSFVE